MASFSDYVQTNETSGRNNWFGRLPEEVQDEAVSARLAGAPYPQIARWLKHEGYSDATKAKVETGIKNKIQDQ